MKNAVKSSVCIALILVLCICVLCACNEDDKDDVYKNPRKLGDFYTLAEAYEQGFISHDDLLNIAYYNHQRYDDIYDFPDDDPNFVGAPLVPEVLSEETKSAICETYAYYMENGIYDTARTNILKVDIKVAEYYGTYNGWTVVGMGRPGAFLASYAHPEIGGIEFAVDFCFYPTMVWKAI